MTHRQMPDSITGKERPVTWEADYRTWLPVAFFSWFPEPRALAKEGRELIAPEPVLHQLWVTPLGEIDWRKVETRNMKEQAKAYAECQAFNESPDDSDLPF